MFMSFAKVATLAALVVTGAAGATVTTSAPASAASLSGHVTIGSSHGVTRLRFGRAHARHIRHRRYRRAGACRPGHALRKARRLGVHRAHIVRLNRRRVVVRGANRRHRVRVVFANRRACPVIAYRR